MAAWQECLQPLMAWIPLVYQTYSPCRTLLMRMWGSRCPISRRDPWHRLGALCLRSQNTGERDNGDSAQCEEGGENRSLGVTGTVYVNINISHYNQT